MIEWNTVCIKIDDWVKNEIRLRPKWKFDLRIYQIENGGASDQASISVDAGDQGGVMEMWASGEMDFTCIDLKKGVAPGVIKTYHFDSPDQAVNILSECFESFANGDAQSHETHDSSKPGRP